MLTESDATTSISNTKCESGGGQQDEGEEQRRSLLQKACVLPAHQVVDLQAAAGSIEDELANQVLAHMYG